MLYYSYTLMFSFILQHCCYSIVCHLVRSLMAFVCQEIKGLLTYLLKLSVLSRNSNARSKANSTFYGWWDWLFENFANIFHGT